MANIFISYSRKDSKPAHKLVSALEEMGHDVWVDWEEIEPAVDWLEKIKRGIEGSDAFVFLVSPHSIKSEVCNVEIGHASLNNKRIVPIVIKDVYSDTANEIITKLNWIFLRSVDNYKEGLAKIKDAIELDFEWVDEHSRLQTRALEWDRKKDASLLLSGRELRRVNRLLRNVTGKEPLPTDLQALYIKHGVQTQARRTVLWVVSTITIILMAGLFFYANILRDEAEKNRVLAEEQAVIAVRNEQDANNQRVLAEQQREIADEQRVIAEEQKLIAQAQRSAARAQIYQSEPDELYTSTLLAVASWKTSPSDEAEEILRKNISLLPIPVNQMYHAGGVNSLEFNTQGDMFVTGGADGKACVWKASDGEMVFCATSPKAVNDAVFSPDSKYIVTGDSSGEVQIIRIVDGTIQSTYNAGTTVWDIDIGRNKNEIAVTRNDGKITILDFQTGKRSYDLQVSGQIRIASFSPNGVYIASGSNNGTVTLWNLVRGGNPISKASHKGEVLALSFSPDSRYLMTGGADGYAVAARTSNGQELYRLLHEDAVTDIAFNPLDVSWFATVSNDHRIRLWDITNGEERLRMSQDSFIVAVRVSANGQWIATTGADRTVRVWNSATGAEMFQIPLASEGAVLGFGGDGNTLVAGDTAGNVNVWDISVMPAPHNYVQFDQLVGDVQFSPNGNWFAASDGSHIWLLSPDQLLTLTTNSLGTPDLTVTGNVSNLIFSPDSNWLGISTDEGYVLAYNLVNHKMQTFTTSGVTHELAFSPDGAQLLVSQSGGGVDAWNLATKEQVVAFAGGIQEVTSFAVGPSRIALGVEDKIDLLDESGAMISPIDSPGDHSQLAFNADETMLASSNSAGNIDLWGLNSGTFTLVGSIRKEAVYSMAFNPFGTELAIGTSSSVYLIDPMTVKEKARIPHAGKVTGLAYSSDGSILATSSLKAIQFWDMTKIQTLDSNDLVDAACSRLTANFSELQWNNLFVGEKYNVLCEDLPVP